MWVTFVMGYIRTVHKKLFSIAVTVSIALFVAVTARGHFERGIVAIAAPVCLIVSFIVIYLLSIFGWTITTWLESARRRRPFGVFVASPEYQDFLGAEGPKQFRERPWIGRRPGRPDER